jgi:hypothetical protein
LTEGEAGRPNSKSTASEFFKLGLPNTARDLDLHPDGLRLATAHHDGILRITAVTSK